MLLWLLILLFIFLLWIAKQVAKPKNYPPGPRWYPFFGCNNIILSRIPQYGSQWKVISEMAKEYSTDVLGLKMGQENVVVVFGEKNIRQVSCDKEFDARPDSFTLRLRCLGQRKGITFVDGPLWREHRMFTMKNLRNQGLGKLSMDSDIHNALNNVLSYIEKSNGNPINIKAIISMNVMNIYWKYIADDQKLLNFINLLNERTKVSTMAGGWLNQWPWLRFLAPEWSGYAPIKRMNAQMTEIINDSIKRHLDKDGMGTDFMYSFLEEMHNQTPTYTVDQLRGICLDFLIAGAQTVGNTFGFIILSAIRNRDIQDKVHNEIVNNLCDVLPSWDDSRRLIYTSAFVAEVQRFYTLAPFSGPRRVLTDVQIGKYTVPKGTTVLVSLGDLHSDSRHWDEPSKFNPGRFIDSNGTFNISAPWHPFGIGRRKCPGQPLAKAALFIILVGILQKYRIESYNGVLPSDEPIIGLLSEPRPFDARFIKRV
ncbi:unnamed protein product, partial [Brenthis ino]